MSDKIFFKEDHDGNRTHIDVQEAVMLEYSKDYIKTVDTGMMVVFRKKFPSYFTPTPRLEFGGASVWY